VAGQKTYSLNIDASGDVVIASLIATDLNASNGIVVNSQLVTSDYTIPSGSNAMSAGPVAVDTGITVTVSSGSVWVIV
jgi:hypothetical protein